MFFHERNPPGSYVFSVKEHVLRLCATHLDHDLEPHKKKKTLFSVSMITTIEYDIIIISFQILYTTLSKMRHILRASRKLRCLKIQYISISMSCNGEYCY